MNETIIANHNSLVKKEDDFYFLGDFALTKDLSKMEMWLKSLNGNKYFIKGNHDHSDTIKLYQRFGVYLGEQKTIKIGEQNIILNHYAMRVWDRSHHGSFCLYGHSHHSLPEDPNSLSFDVGINGYNYFPLEFEQVKEIMSKKIYKPIDHHR